MRFALALIAMTTILAAPAMADDSRHTFTGTNCTQHDVPCPITGSFNTPETPLYMTNDQVADVANQCLLNNLAMKVDQGFFDTYAGPDSNNCLPIRRELLASKNTKSLFPRCCIVQRPNTDRCMITCDITNGW